jgi:hypothetical protein
MILRCVSLLPSARMMGMTSAMAQFPGDVDGDQLERGLWNHAAYRCHRRRRRQLSS